jgi:hypothetical protein
LSPFETSFLVRFAIFNQHGVISIPFLEEIKVRETRRDNQERTIQRRWQHWAHQTQDEDKQNKGQPRTYNTETLVTLGTTDTGRR